MARSHLSRSFWPPLGLDQLPTGGRTFPAAGSPPVAVWTWSRESVPGCGGGRSVGPATCSPACSPTWSPTWSLASLACRWYRCRMPSKRRLRIQPTSTALAAASSTAEPIDLPAAASNTVSNTQNTATGMNTNARGVGGFALRRLASPPRSARTLRVTPNLALLHRNCVETGTTGTDVRWGMGQRPALIGCG